MPTRASRPAAPSSEPADDGAPGPAIGPTRRLAPAPAPSRRTRREACRECSVDDAPGSRRTRREAREAPARSRPRARRDGPGPQGVPRRRGRRRGARSRRGRARRRGSGPGKKRRVGGCRSASISRRPARSRVSSVRGEMSIPVARYPARSSALSVTPQPQPTSSTCDGGRMPQCFSRSSVSTARARHHGCRRMIGARLTRISSGMLRSASPRDHRSIIGPSPDRDARHAARACRRAVPHPATSAPPRRTWGGPSPRGRSAGCTRR